MKRRIATHNWTGSLLESGLVWYDICFCLSARWHSFYCIHSIWRGLQLKLARFLVCAATAQEGKCMERARRAGVDAPLLLFVDTLCCRIYMERIAGVTVKAFLRSARRSDEGTI